MNVKEFNYKSIEFNYKNNIITVQGKDEEKMKTIIDRFLAKGYGIKDNIVFLYDGKKIDEKMTLSQQANKFDKLNKKMSIIAFDFNDIDPPNDPNIKNLKKSKNIICPECNENIRIKIDAQKITLYECRNNHKKDDILLEQFEKTQYIDETQIICNVCKNNKDDVYGKKFYICFKCKFKLCPLCKNKHDKSHFIINYDEKYYICANHFESYSSYCYDCKKDICAMCEKEHSGHKSITYGSILPDMNEVNSELTNFKQTIDEYKNEINKIIEKLKNNLNNLDIYYKISYDIINNYENKNRNYAILQNINDFNDFMKNLSKIIYGNNIVNKINNIISLFYKNLEEKKDKVKERNEKEKIKENEITKIKEEENSGNMEEEENENEEIQKYNPSDDNKLEDFDISKLKETKKFETNYYFIIRKLIILNDQRILSYQKSKNRSEISVYDVNNNFKCNFLEANEVNSMFQMNDGNVIILYSNNKIKVVKVKKNCFENIQELDDKFYHIYKISEETILATNENGLQKYSYEKGKLIDKKNNGFDNTKIDGCTCDICRINNNEIAFLYYKKGLVFGFNEFLLFYDILNYKNIKNLKLGDGSGANFMELMNENTLILERNSKIVIIDTTKRIIKDEIKFGHRIESIVLLNENNFLIRNSENIYQCKIDKYFNFTLKKQKSIKSDLIAKYPGNKLIIYKDKEICIYETKEIKENIYKRFDRSQKEPLIGIRYTEYIYE